MSSLLEGSGGITTSGLIRLLDKLNKPCCCEGGGCHTYNDHRQQPLFPGKYHQECYNHINRWWQEFK